MNRPAVHSKQAATATPVASGLLQRKCACGSHTIAGGECAGCSQGKKSLQGRTSQKGLADSGLSTTQGAVMQRKLSIGASNDALEREADQVAEQVHSASAHSAVSSAPPRIQRIAGRAGQNPGSAPVSVERVLGSSGKPLEAGLRQDMGNRFGYDFSQVRVHIGSEAEQSAREVNARAYTVGQNIVFGAGEFRPQSYEGSRLLAHELTHVVQQSGQAASRAPLIQRKADTDKPKDSSRKLLHKLKREQGNEKARLPLTPEVLAWVAALRSGEVEPTDADPAKGIGDLDSTYENKRHEGEAFTWGEGDMHGADVTDVNQGGLGDCYFMALLAAIAEVRPDAIEQMVKPNADGSFTVSFFAPDGKMIHEKVWPTFPTDYAGDPAFAEPGDKDDVYGKELWPMLIEKAWMQVRGSWRNMEGGQSDPVQHAIGMTGNVREIFALPGALSEKDLFDKLEKHFKAKQPITIFSPMDTDPKPRQKKATKAGVIINHAYALWHVNSDSKTVDLYNPHGPAADHLLNKDMRYLKTNFARIAFFKMKEAELSTTRQGPSKEEQLGAEAIPKQILKESRYDLLVADFEKTLSGNSSAFMAKVTVQDFGKHLWEHAKLRAQDAKKADTDDRPLYWARLAAATFIRSFVPSKYNLTPVEKQLLLDVLEASSRGRTSIDFPGRGADVRRILVSGFDPFQLRDLGLRKANPSGAAVLALDGQTIPAASGSRAGSIEGVIFPVRFADFDRGMVETTFRPYLQEKSKKVDMIMTISQGGSTLKTSDAKMTAAKKKELEAEQSKAFELERYAGRHRAAPGVDNQEVAPVKSGLKEGKRLTKGEDFIESSLPRREMSGREETKAESDKELSAGGKEVGSGGGFLSNEIFYRTAALNATSDEKSRVPVGHLHVPILPAPDGSAESEKTHTSLRDTIIQWVKKLISNALKHMGI
jgi:pyrrolidone-carboxylate peptidase